LSELAGKDKNFIFFENVFSTHAHTRSSLLEAFSFGLNSDEIYLPITKRKQLPVVDLLRKGKLESTLISNQGMGGLWDHTSSVVFKSSNLIFRENTQHSGNGGR